MARDEVEAAYFTLLRAREELDALRRYDEYLGAEAARLRRTTSEAAALRDPIDRRLLRRIEHTDRPLHDAIDARMRVVTEERAQLPDRITAAEEFVRACEQEHESLRQGR